MVEDHNKSKGRVCVTGGTGYLGSWMVKRLLEDGYSVNITIRIDPDRKRDISFLTNLPGASERLKIYNADLDNPTSFAAAIEGCDGVFHMAHPLDFEEKESEETKIKRVTTGVQGILQACIDSKTVKRVMYTSSISAAALNGSNQIDENSWTDVDLVRSFGAFGGPYVVTKTLAEKIALEFAEKSGLDLVSVLPTWTTGPFICPHLPDSVQVAMALILGTKQHYNLLKSTSLVHVDDIARAHIHLFEDPNAKGRYLCTGVEFSIEELCDFISKRYPQYEMPTADSLKDLIPLKFSGIPSKKLLETGFKYENGLEEMFDGAIGSYKEKGEKKHYHFLKSSSLVHVDDVARAHIHLFEHPEAKGRYLCTGVEFSIEDLCEFISARYTEYEIPTADSLKDLLRSLKFSGIPSNKLLETGFEYENGLEEMYDGAIKCCKEKGLL